MGGNIPSGNFLGGDFPVGGIFQGGVWWVEIFRVGIFLEPKLCTNRETISEKAFETYISLFIHSYLNYVNVGWVSTSKSNVLFPLSRSSRPEVFS